MGKGTEEMEDKIEICPVCGKEFNKWKGGRVYCSDKCRNMYHAKRHNEMFKKEPEVKKKKKVKKGKTISQISAEAREAGMTYGQYVAAMEFAKKV